VYHDRHDTTQCWHVRAVQSQGPGLIWGSHPSPAVQSRNDLIKYYYFTTNQLLTIKIKEEWFSSMFPLSNIRYTVNQIKNELMK